MLLSSIILAVVICILISMITRDWVLGVVTLCFVFLTVFVIVLPLIVFLDFRIYW